MKHKVIVAIIAIFFLELAAILKGLDGLLLAGAIAAITGLGGYEIGYHRKPK